MMGATALSTVGFVVRLKSMSYCTMQILKVDVFFLARMNVVFKLSFTSAKGIINGVGCFTSR